MISTMPTSKIAPIKQSMEVGILIDWVIGECSMRTTIIKET